MDFNYFNNVFHFLKEDVIGLISVQFFYGQKDYSILSEKCPEIDEIKQNKNLTWEKIRQYKMDGKNKVLYRIHRFSMKYAWKSWKVHL